MPDLSITIPGPPVGWQRAAPNRFGGKTNREKTRKHEQAIRSAAVMAAVHARVRIPIPVDVPVRVDVEAYCKRPKAYQGPVGAHRRISGGYPDRDNITKAVLDGLQGTRSELGLLTDDRQVDCGETRRFCCGLGEQPRTVIRVRW